MQTLRVNNTFGQRSRHNANTPAAGISNLMMHINASKFMQVEQF